MSNQQTTKPQQNQQLARPRPLDIIKTSLLSTGAIKTFMDNLPSAVGEQSQKMAERFAKMVYTAVCQNPDLQTCTPHSIIKAASISASLGLDIDPRGLAYLVPYKNEATFQIGYQGLIELAYRSGKVKDISAHCIYESERNNVIIRRIDGRFSIEHPFEWDMPKGELIAVYATAEVEGLGPKILVLRRDEVEYFRSKSKCPNSPAWKNDYPAMAKKTAIRQLAKFLPKSICEDLTRAAAIDEKESFAEASGNAAAQIEQDAGSEMIDVSFEQSGQQPTPAEASPTFPIQD